MRPLPEPAIMLMHDHQEITPADKPSWGPFDSWMYWTWAQLNPADGVYKFGVVNDYLRRAEARGVKAAISVLVLPDAGQDCTPQWVFERIGAQGWPVVVGPDGMAVGTFPRWNDGTWDSALARFVAAFGARFDGDPRIHSVWITFARYGETVLDGLGSDLHNPGRYFRNCINWYDAAFPTTPLCALITGPTDRLSLAETCMERGIVVKFNALVRDSPTHVMLKPTPGGGHAQIAKAAMSRGLPTAWEHYYPANAPETYWAIVTALGLGCTVLDLPAQHLDALAAIPGLWAWALEVMGLHQERVGLYVARDTAYPAPGNGWEHGWPGPWERGVTTNATCYAPTSDGYKAAPASLRETLEGYGGMGYCDGDLVITSTLPEGDYDVVVTYATQPYEDGWGYWHQTAAFPGSVTVATGPCWLHAVEIAPASPEPLPPDDDADLAGDVAVLHDRADALEYAMASLAGQLGNAQAALTDLRGLLDDWALLERVEELERWRQAVADVTAIAP